MAPYRFACYAIEDVQKAELSASATASTIFPFWRRVIKLWGRGGFVVPQVRMDEVEVPHQLARPGVERRRESAKRSFPIQSAPCISLGGGASREVGDTRFSSTDISPQVLVPPAYFQASFGQVSYPNYPG